MAASKRWARNRRLKCGCMGYHFPHRKGGGACDHSRTRDIHIAKRGGDRIEIAEAVLDMAFVSGGQRSRSQHCPF